MNEQSFIDDLRKQFGGETVEFAGDISLVVRREDLAVAARKIRDMGFERLSDITAVDYYPEENPRFHLFYHFVSVSGKATLSLRVPVPGLDPSVVTLEKVYPNANWREREVFDMFGITIEGHSDPRRILMPQDWEGYPLRKDYPLGYEEPQFTFNYEEIDVRKPHARKDDL